MNIHTSVRNLNQGTINEEVIKEEVNLSQASLMQSLREDIDQEDVMQRSINNTALSNFLGERGGRNTSMIQGESDELQDISRIHEQGMSVLLVTLIL